MSVAGASPSRWFRIDPDEPIVPPPGMRHGSAMVVVDQHGRVLLQQRDDPQPPEGYGRWAIPGGGLEPGETPRQCAVREILEETGIVAERPRYFESVEVGEHHDGKGGLTMHMFFTVQEVDPAEVQVNEGIDMKFWTEEEARTLRVNPNGKEWLLRFLDSDQYQHSAGKKHSTTAAGILALDRWGRVLLQLRDRDLPPDLFPSTWGTPGGGIEEGESPDEAALREFEEETGHRLEELHFFRTFTKEEFPQLLVRTAHYYYCDPDLDLEQLECLEGERLEYFGPGDLNGLPITPTSEPVLRLFFESPAYKGLFH